MSIELNHTIVHVKDRWAASRDVGRLLGLPDATAYGPFAELKLDNGVSLDFMDTEGEIHGQHYAFLVSEDDFDLVLGRLRADGREWWADPFKRRRTRSTTTTAAAASTGRDPTGTGWRSSPVRTAAAADHAELVAVGVGQHHPVAVALADVERGSRPSETSRSTSACWSPSAGGREVEVHAGSSRSSASPAGRPT